MTGLITMREAAARLRCSPKTLNAHIRSGALRYVITGAGAKRPRRMFTDADLDEFIEGQTRRDAPCQSIARKKARRSTTTISKSTVLDFTALRDAATAGRPKA